MQRVSYIIALIFAGSSYAALARSPKMTVIFVIDQLSAHYLEKLRPFLKGGIASLLGDGIEYTNAFYDASPPSTAHGHALLTTGTYGSIHGIVANWWRTPDLKQMLCDQDCPTHAAVFAPDGTTLPYGKSANNMLVDNLSDQLMLHSYPHARTTVWSLSMKSRAAILMAGKMGKAAWLDEKTKNYTTSKAYFDKLPQWISDSSTKLDLGSQLSVTWKSFYPLCSPQYSFDEASEYTSSQGTSLINKRHDLSDIRDFKSIYQKSPQATSDFFTFARDCITTQYKDTKNDRFVLWLNLASLDKVGHEFGPYSQEALDTLYHIDNQMQKFIEFIYTKAPKEEVLFVLTGDHGIQPLPETLQKKGYTAARRYVASAVITDLNKIVEKKHGITNLVHFFISPQFFLDMTRLKHLSAPQKQEVMNTIKNHLMSLPGMRKAWTFDELEKTHFEPYDLDHLIKKELYRGRSGQIFYSANPYTALYKAKKGAMHSTQYAYDTRVPLIFSQAGRFTKKRIDTTRSMTQVSVTLAALLEVPRPSAATASVLPELLP